MAFVQVWKMPGITLEQYDKVQELWTGGKLADGENFHVAGIGDDGLWVIDGWESREKCDAAAEKYLKAAEEAGLPVSEMSGIEPQEFEIHNLMQGG